MFLFGNAIVPFVNDIFLFGNGMCQFGIDLFRLENAMVLIEKDLAMDELSTIGRMLGRFDE